MTGLCLILGSAESQYSRASMFTLRWSMPSWQMSACGLGGLEEGVRGVRGQRGRETGEGAQCGTEEEGLCSMIVPAGYGFPQVALPARSFHIRLGI